MKWMPKWIGSVYSKLWVTFKENTFNFNQAKKIDLTLTDLMN